MVLSLNHQVDLVMEGTSFMGIARYGKIMIGDQAFEFYDDQNKQHYIQIPWQEITLISASVHFKGKWIPRFEIKTRHDGTFRFAARKPKQLLKRMQQYVDPNIMIQAPSFWQVIKKGFSKPKKDS